VRLGFAHSTQTVFYAMAAVLAVNLVVARVWLPRGRVEATAAEPPQYAVAGRSPL
jgi:hypothetical protein